MKARFISWNFFGLLVPLILGLISIPSILQNLGSEKFGLLALAWGLIGYASTFDFGIGRSLTLEISRGIAKKNEQLLADLQTTGTRLTLIIGLIVFLLLSLSIIFGITSLFKTTSVEPSEIFYSFLIVSFAIPIQAMSATYKGINEGLQNFIGINIIRIFLGGLNFLAPLAISYFSKDLIFIFSSLLASRVLALIFYRFLSVKKISNVGFFSKNYAKKIIKFGSWVTVSSILNPLLNQSDRFLISVVIGAAAVSTYVIPYELVIQSSIIVTSISTVAYPVFSQITAKSYKDIKPYFNKVLIYSTLLMLIVCIATFFILPYFLQFWLGNNYEELSTSVGKILCFGIFFNSIGIICYSLIHANGRSDITAKFHLLETPMFLIALFYLLNSYGLIGAAIAWSLRMILDAILLGGYCYFRIFKSSKYEKYN